MPHPSLFSGVLHRFGRDLDADPRIAYRFLAERAHDACVRRGRGDPDLVPAILVGTQMIGGRAHVSFSDNGAPLSGDEIKQVYDALQQGLIDETKKTLAANGLEGAHKVIGRLGVAMLGAFLIADMVSIRTRASVNPGVRYTCSSSTYTVEDYQMARAGTVVQLRVRKEREAVADLSTVRDALVSLKQLSPIMIGTEATPVNA